MAMERADYLITGGLVVSGGKISRQDILVRGETIQEVGPELSDRSATRTIDAAGKYVLPGAVDAHNHPVNTDRIDTFSVSAAFGGITTVIPFIRNLRDRGIEGTTSDAIRAFIEEGERSSHLDFGVHAILVGDDDVDGQVPELIRMGVISFKMFMTYPRRGMMMPDDKMLRAMALASQDGGVAMVHAENGYCIDYLADRFTAEGKTSPEYYALSQPRVLEVEAATRAASYASVSDCPLYIVHLSAREVLDVLARFKGDGLRLYGETCPQYLDLTNQVVLDFGALAKIGPPLREREDNEAMWRGIADHLIDTIGSDFVGFNKAQKFSGGRSLGAIQDQADVDESASIFEASFGGNWAEQMLPVVYEEGVNRGRITLCRLVQVMCENPAKIFGLYPRKGCLQAGSDADIVLFDPSLRHTLSAEAQHCKSDFTMFEGKEVLGKPVFSMQRGEIVIEDGELRRPAGRARFLPGNSEQAAYAPNGHRVE
ncbi:MAG: amidohydrolase family protein [Chloroflexi bacterium]|nr:amidohydrolase family protein [Chloroflexota bacterium]